MLGPWCTTRAVAPQSGLPLAGIVPAWACSVSPRSSRRLAAPELDSVSACRSFKDLVEMHGGTVKAMSEGIGEGSGLWSRFQPIATKVDVGLAQLGFRSLRASVVTQASTRKCYEFCTTLPIPAPKHSLRLRQHWLVSLSQSKHGRGKRASWWLWIIVIVVPGASTAIQSTRHVPFPARTTVSRAIY